MSFHNRLLKIFALSLFGVQCVLAQGKTDFWDLEPIRYSDTLPTDRLAVLAKKLEERKLAGQPRQGLKALEFVLAELNVPKESQVLVFSKTSLQNSRITPRNPRSLYFSENAYVGYVPGGAVEAIVHDAVLGPVYYLVEPDKDGAMRIERDTNRCLSCHATSRTENVPGMLIRSVYAEESGHPILQLGTHDVAHETPLADRWGGWFVTGRSSLPHLGNRVFTEESDLTPSTIPIKSVAGMVDVKNYLRPTSDVVSLLVLEHQVKMHNLLNAAAMNYRRSVYFMQTLNPDADPAQGSAGEIADSSAKDIVDYLFFKHEADLGDGVEGDAGFQQTFVKRFPKSKNGESLAEFRLYGRIFKNRCSYMVYSEAFKGMPPGLKQKVIARMKRVVAGEEEGFEYLKESERKRIDTILSETLKDWKQAS
ncbi:MAG: hypothetical protein V4727_10620 [Verrucomicrobiota bacterium]